VSRATDIDHVVIAVSDWDVAKHFYFRDPDGSLLEFISYD
jgi:catechol 2,3-dioxygenase-like lactoylglutathione lyase family enzyme